MKSLTNKATDILKGFTSGASMGQAAGSSADQAGASAAGAVGAAQSTASEVGQTMKADGCADCAKGTCSHKEHHYHHVSKAITSRSMAIPFHMRQPAYDPDGIRRSATTQTSRMYTALAEPVKDTLRHVMEQSDEDPMRRVAKAQEANRQHAQDMRKQLADAANQTRKSLHWTR